MIGRLLRRPILWVAAGLAAVMIDVLVMGSTIIPLELAGTTPLGPAGYGPHRLVLPTSTSSDPAGAYDAELAWLAYFVRSVHGGTLPLWNPHQGLGQPHLANYISSVLYPINWLTLALPPAWWDVIYIVNWFLCALFVYRLARVFGAGRHGACVGAFGVFASGYLALNLAVKSVMGTIVWFPFLIYAIERTFRQPRWRWRHVALAAGTFGLATGGHPAPALVGGALTMTFALLRVGLTGAGLRTLLLDIVPSMALGGFIASPQLLPFAENVLRDGVAVHGVEVGLLSSPVATLPGFALPFIFGPLHNDPWHGLYVSVAWVPPGVAFLAVAGLVTLWTSTRRPMLVAFVITAALAAAKVLGAPGINDLGRLPLLNQIWFQYANAFIALPAAVLAAVGFSGLRKAPLRQWVIAIILWGLYIGVMIVVAVAVLHGGGATLASLSSLRRHYFYVALGSGLGWAIAMPVALLIARVAGRRDNLFLLVGASGVLLEAAAYFPSGSPITFAVINLLAGAAFVATVTAGALLGRRLRAVPAMAIAVTVTALVSGVSTSVQPRLARRYDWTRASGYVTWLQRAPNAPRVYGFDGVLYPDFPTVFGLSSPTNLENLVPHEANAFFGAYLDPAVLPARFFGISAGRNPTLPDAIGEFWGNRRYWDLIAVQYLLTSRGASDAPAVYESPVKGGSALQAVFRDADTGVTVWKNSSAGERAFLAPDVRTAPSAQAAMAQLTNIEDLHRTVVIETPTECAGDASVTSGAAGRLALLELMPNTVRLDYEARSRGVLTLTDSYAKGWRATVDGRDTPVLRVDGVFRGVCITGPGVHHVEFTYRPTSWPFALGLSVVGMVTIGAWTRVGMRRRR